MPDTVTMNDARYTLAEAAVFSEPRFSTATSDAFAEPEVINLPAQSPAQRLGKVAIRKRGSEFTAEIQAEGPHPQSFVKSVARIVDLLALEPGWNSYSAQPIDRENAIRAIELLWEFLSSKTPLPIVVPTVRRGIQLEWHTRGIEIEIYINSPTNVSFFAEDLESSESTEQSLANHEDELKSWLDRISAE